MAQLGCLTEMFHYSQAFTVLANYRRYISYCRSTFAFVSCTICPLQMFRTKRCIMYVCYVCVCVHIYIYIIHLPSMLHTPPITTRPYHQPYNKLSDFVRTAKPLSKACPQRNAKNPPSRTINNAFYIVVLKV